MSVYMSQPLAEQDRRPDARVRGADRARGSGPRVEPESSVHLAGEEIRLSVAVDVAGADDLVVDPPSGADLHRGRIPGTAPGGARSGVEPQGSVRLPGEQIGLAVAVQVSEADDRLRHRLAGDGELAERGRAAVEHILVAREHAGVGPLPHRVSAPARRERTGTVGDVAGVAGDEEGIRAECRAVSRARRPPSGGRVDRGQLAGARVHGVREVPDPGHHRRGAEPVAGVGAVRRGVRVVFDVQQAAAACGRPRSIRRRCRRRSWPGSRPSSRWESRSGTRP